MPPKAQITRLPRRDELPTSTSARLRLKPSKYLIYKESFIFGGAFNSTLPAVSLVRPAFSREYERFIDLSDIISTLRLKAERQVGGL
jgi:hypothetical protein